MSSCSSASSQGALPLTSAGFVAGGGLWAAAKESLSIGPARTLMLRTLFGSAAFAVGALLVASAAAGLYGWFDDGLTSIVRSRYLAGGPLFALGAIGAAAVLLRQVREARRAGRLA